VLKSGGGLQEDVGDAVPFQQHQQREAIRSLYKGPMASWRFHSLSMAMSFICLQKTWESHSSETALRLLACEGVVGTIGPSKVLTHHIKL